MREQGSDRPDPEGAQAGSAPEGPAAEASAVEVDDLASLSPEQLTERVRRAREEALRNWQHFLHSAADLENYKKQAQRDRQDAVERTRRQMLSLVIGVLDNLDRALAFSDASAASRALVDGLRMTQRQILDQLAALGVSPMETVGKTFDPRLHEAVAAVPPRHAGETAGTIVSEVLRGYRLNDEVLRPAKVTVVGSTGSDDPARKGAGRPG